jgi:hypothetical protein
VAKVVGGSLISQAEIEGHLRRRLTEFGDDGVRSDHEVIAAAEDSEGVETHVRIGDGA